MMTLRACLMVGMLWFGELLLGLPSLSAPSLSAPSLSAPSLSAPSLSAQVLSEQAFAVQAFGGLSAYAADESAKIDSEKALKRITGRWFNSQNSAYRPPVFSRRIDDNIRRNGWLAAPKSPRPTNTRPAWSWANLGLDSEVFGWLVLGVLGTALLAGLIALAHHYLGDYMPVLRRKSDSRAVNKIDLARVDALPFEVPVVSDDPLSQAEALMRAGRYNEAVVYLYGYMLLALDQARKLHLQRGKTNRMYLRELRSETQLHGITSNTMLAFEDVFFGRYDIDRARFEALWQQREAFHQLIRPVAPPVTDPVAKVAAV